jgi:[CysO sulfur-carrier protein]-thiocarboxylate-dependent cysteine synthase
VALHDSVLDLIGDTPMVDISRLSPNPRVRIYAKLEGQNPGGSVKDRAAKYMITDGEKNGLLEPGATVLESSSGNTGIALAMICKMRGYRFKVVLPENVSIERRQLLEVWGAEIIDSPAAEGSNGAMRRAQVMAGEHPDWFFPFQYGNSANPQAHYEGTGPEIWRDCPEVTHFVAGLGTSGTFMGTGRRLKQEKATVQLISVQPDGPFHGLEGLKHMESAIVPPIYDPRLADEATAVDTDEAWAMVRRLAREEGVFVGVSGAAALVATLRAAAAVERGVFVTIIPDGGERYLSERQMERA